jgi:RecB family endonuclease NucS
MAERPEIDWEAIRQTRPGLSILEIESNESGLMRILKTLAQTNKLCEALDIPEGVIQFEFPVPRGRADIVVFHNDGTVSAIEVKGFRDLRGVLDGIGQVIMYSVQLGYSKTTKGIRKILIAPYSGEDPEALLIHSACKSAGVEFVPFGTLAEHQDNIHELLCQRCPEFVKVVQ